MLMLALIMEGDIMWQVSVFVTFRNNRCLSSRSKLKFS